MCGHAQWSYGFLVAQYLHTVMVLSTTLLPSSYLTGKSKCSHTWDLNEAGGFSSSSALFFLFAFCNASIQDWFNRPRLREQNTQLLLKKSSNQPSGFRVKRSTHQSCLYLFTAASRRRELLLWKVTAAVKLYFTLWWLNFAIDRRFTSVPNRGGWSIPITDQLWSVTPVLYTSATTASEITATLNKELQLVSEWVARNKLLQTPNLN